MSDEERLEALERLQQAMVTDTERFAAIRNKIPNSMRRRLELGLTAGELAYFREEWISGETHPVLPGQGPADEPAPQPVHASQRRNGMRLSREFPSRHLIIQLGPRLPGSAAGSLDTSGRVHCVCEWRSCGCPGHAFLSGGSLTRSRTGRESGFQAALTAAPTLPFTARCREIGTGQPLEAFLPHAIGGCGTSVIRSGRRSIPQRHYSWRRCGSLVLAAWVSRRGTRSSNSSSKKYKEFFDLPLVIAPKNPFCFAISHRVSSFPFLRLSPFLLPRRH